MKSGPRTVILGAGMAGLSAAWHLQRRGISCLTLEKEVKPGGLCRSRRIKNFIFDYSGHLLHFKHPYTFRFIKALLGKNLQKHERSAWVYYRRSYIPYPFQANLWGLPEKIMKECVTDFVKARKKARTRPNACSFEKWALRTFGKGIARHFLIPYNTKFWTVSPQGLTCDWVDQMIPIPSVRQVVEGSKRNNQERFGYNAFFWYPKTGGIGKVPEALARQINNIRTQSTVRKIDLIKKQIILSSGRTVPYGRLISTLPLPEMIRLVYQLPSGVKAALKKLRWSSILNLNLGIKSWGNQGRHWVYFPERTPCFFRVGFFHNFSGGLAPSARQSFYAEVSYSKNKPVGKREIITSIERDLKKTGLISAKDQIEVKDLNDIKYGYPIYDRSYRAARGKIINFLNRYGVIPCGRYGSWRYMSMEDAILDGKAAAETVAQGLS